MNSGRGCGVGGMYCSMDCGIRGIAYGMGGMASVIDSGMERGMSGMESTGGMGGMNDVGMLAHPPGMSGMRGATTTW